MKLFPVSGKTTTVWAKKPAGSSPLPGADEPPVLVALPQAAKPLQAGACLPAGRAVAVTPGAVAPSPRRRERRRSAAGGRSPRERTT
jgi:hypothetical protein